MCRGELSAAMPMFVGADDAQTFTLVTGHHQHSVQPSQVSRAPVTGHIVCFSGIYRVGWLGTNPKARLEPAGFL